MSPQNAHLPNRLHTMHYHARARRILSADVWSLFPISAKDNPSALSRAARSTFTLTRGLPSVLPSRRVEGPPAYAQKFASVPVLQCTPGNL